METHSRSIRVLVRPPPNPSHPLPPQPPPPPPPPLPPPADPYSTPKNGVVVVGFIGKRHHDVAHLMNKIIDSRVFGSGNLDTPFRFEPDKINPDMGKWLQSRKLSFYHDVDQGILYLQFSSAGCPVAGEGPSETRFGFESVFDDQEFGDLKGLIFMFSVCHIILLIQEGSRFDTQILKKFRILQSAKHAMSPFTRSQNPPPVTSRPPSSAHSQTSHNNPSPGKSRAILNRNTASSIKTMSGVGSSYTSLLPGQCTPVVLFVFLDDFTEIKMEDSTEASSLNTKGSGSVVVLARPVNKPETSPRKKLQSSLEAQIRFSIKKCRTLSVFESSSHSGSRGAPPLFSLDSSKAVLLIDACSIQSGESLEFAIGLVREVLDGKATPDSLLLESHQQNTKKEDVLSVKEFIYRQCDLIRGRGGVVAAGVGMVAAAAAAAAASTSAASGKMTTVPELPTVGSWASTSQLILHGILSSKRSHENEQDIISQSGENFEYAVSHLENGIGLNTRFSTSWCEKAFPIAKEVYLDGLPPCYPSSQHEDHLRKALHTLTSSAKGPALQIYVKKLKDECTSIWLSERQLCDAVSLTGKPCMHQRHDIEIKSHSSGFVYLHACACGRSRQLRPDPFDYETANVACNNLADCDKLLPAVKLPHGSTVGPVQPSSWNLIRVGGARYYDPSKGLLQSGFCATQKFLLKWTVFLDEPNESIHLLNRRNIGVIENTVNTDSKIDALQNGPKIQIKLSSDTNGNSNKNVSLGKGLPNFTMRKPFSEVVAGPAAVNSGFPPLLSRKQPIQDTEKGFKLHARSKAVDKFGEDIALTDEAVNNGNKSGDDFPPIGSKEFLMSMNGDEHVKAANSVKSVVIYVGFEYECPHGHRFILTPDHLNELGSSYSVPEENSVPFPAENFDKKQDLAKLGKFGDHGRTRRQSNGIIMGGGKNLDRSKEKAANGNTNKFMQSSRHGKEIDPEQKPTTVDDGGFAFSLLSRNLPIYMNCPHCRNSVTKNGASNTKFAGTISQLQRIFVVTPSFPIMLSADPIVQFEPSCLHPNILDREKKLQFSLGCPVILPPESFLSLRLPFVYGVELEDGSQHSLKPFENQPQLTACIKKGTTLKIVSNRNSLDPASVT
ncbi:hypothetical protein MIMGU_mgv1a023242mg [Erythranthe guttata]|uniref:Nonsense-mediated mRNA decay factor SMG8 n=2 Tax=Erythranthe guttata TaxID=4155 RepID=A0A022RDS4_ERYGU|nr:PREDICTED: uncharacterized protein LOC105958554 isoform X1 [Erythranthe guttata]XP_012838010.1 PREDICTED: uncharacterized protein LOC105958554 isoform X1 [Erythranthe guttata]XP_012838011.1 PREDICTED: uncharacterized protein LOC105958554 isoform X1 [Erythranthe guttata]EYU37030.1 hypothetical protein MIMGU_mgv1a023242mg [Erythranthe guttata]|eukprot:XP_012838009.1 PREDICTED: uncharacterized protein LOC105958554 isoform X1 [Erythranthe guttata]